MKLAKLHDGPEIFHTIQGEGVSAGTPAVFVRASRCNLHCRWCDTEYTWNFTGTPWPHDHDDRPGGAKHDKASVILDLPPADVAAEIARHACRRVVLTGGEPLLQQDEWLEVIARLRQRDPGYVFEVETNGTLVPSPAFDAAIDQFNVSPKLAHAGMPESLRLVPGALAHFAASPRSWFKFVAATPADLVEIEALADRFTLPADRILIMPEGRTADQLDRHAAGLIDACLARGWRFGDRLHVRIWGDRRGV
jgi:organic radical activating enzyme